MGLGSRRNASGLYSYQNRGCMHGRKDSSVTLTRHQNKGSEGLYYAVSPESLLEPG